MYMTPEQAAYGIDLFYEYKKAIFKDSFLEQI